jgi:hypothetical protein
LDDTTTPTAPLANPKKLAKVQMAQSPFQMGICIYNMISEHASMGHMQCISSNLLLLKRGYLQPKLNPPDGTEGCWFPKLKPF